MGERQIDNGLFCSDKFRFLLDQYNRQTDYARGISEKMLALLFVFLGFYYGHLRRLPDGHGHRVLLGVTVLGSAAVVGCYVFLCARNSQRCWKSYHGLENVSHTENIELADIGIVENEPRFSVWAWCLGFMVIYALFVGAETYYFLTIPALTAIGPMKLDAVSWSGLRSA